jgi:hypothetical protein
LWFGRARQEELGANNQQRKHRAAGTDVPTALSRRNHMPPLPARVVVVQPSTNYFFFLAAFFLGAAFLAAFFGAAFFGAAAFFLATFRPPLNKVCSEFPHHASGSPEAGERYSPSPIKPLRSSIERRFVATQRMLYERNHEWLTMLSSCVVVRIILKNATCFPHKSPEFNNMRQEQMQMRAIHARWTSVPVMFTSSPDHLIALATQRADARCTSCPMRSRSNCFQ